MIAMLALELPLLSVALVYNYAAVCQGVLDNFALMEKQTQADMFSAMSVMDESLKAWSDRLRPVFESGFGLFLDEYELSGSDPFQMNLTRVVNQLGPGFDLYVINASAVVIMTTYPPDQWLDFRQWPHFAEALARIRTGGELVMDRLTPETQSGMVRIYAYMPTPDHQYVLEIGLITDTFSPYLSKVNYMDLASDVAASNPYVLRIRVFGNTGFQVGNSSFIPNEEHIHLIKSVIDSDSPVVVSDSATKRVFVAVNFIDSKFPTRLTLVVEMTYDIAMTNQILWARTLEHVFLGITLALAACVATWYVARRVTQPLSQMVDSVDRITSGDLALVDVHWSSQEMTLLAKSINVMVTSLRSLSTRTQLYMDILCHDLRNWLQAMVIGIELISLTDQSQSILLALEKANQCAELCRKTIEKLSAAESAFGERLRRRDLGPILRSLMTDFELLFPDTELRELLFLDHAIVETDSFLEDCLWFVLENAVVHNTFEKRVVEVWFMHEGNGVLVAVADNGPGISEADRSHVFDITRRYGGISLHIASSFLSKYGGYIEIDDSVWGHSEGGSLFAVWLPLEQNVGSSRPKIYCWA